ncbi:MAG: DUF378 domain-containing protein [bacterium]|nr:DUF378 domain-containing protein [bacterium]
MSHNFHKEGVIGRTAFVLVMLGGLAWGVMGLLELNPIAAIFGEGIVARIIYHLIGLSALYVIFRKQFRRAEHHE